jgi:hypothetical protein
LSDFAHRPSILGAASTPKPWGGELWLTSARPEGAARIAGEAGTLADRIAAHPEALGRWSRALFGDELPIFAKIIHTRFPPRVHIGFRRPIERGAFLSLLAREQEQLRDLRASLRVGDELAFVAYQGVYGRWASDQSLAGWRLDDDAETARALSPYFAPSWSLAPWLRAVRENRAAIVDALNDVDLRRESGNLLLTSAGIVHAIFGLSYQTHPADRSRRALEALFARLEERAAAGAGDDDLAAMIDAAGLSGLRAANDAPPKNEGWLHTVVDGGDALVEPQQSSDTTYSVADFFTPLTWGEGPRGGVRFRKGDPGAGLTPDTLRVYADGVDFAVTSIDRLRRSPVPVEAKEASRPDAQLFRLVDEPSTWPFFTAYKVELRGAFVAAPPPGVSQQIVVTRGRVGLEDARGPIGELSVSAPAFVPATMTGGYRLVARESAPATVWLFATPGARGGAPRVLESL